jgi:acyl-CoA synthetase (AMP-forming)/AMP-acid ligase II
MTYEKVIMSFRLLDTFLCRANIVPEYTALIDIRHTSREYYEEERISYGQLKQRIELIAAYFKQANVNSYMMIDTATNTHKNT